MNEPTRRSPVAALLEATSAVTGGYVLRDLMHLSKRGFKGPGVQDWWRRQGLPWPERMYDVDRPGADTLLVRTGSDELVVESSAGRVGDMPSRSALDAWPAGVYPFEQQSATFELEGRTAAAIWEQTCGVHIASLPADRIVFTRVAGASCGIIPVDGGSERVYRIWVDYSYAPYLWQTLTGIGDGLESD